MADMNANTGFLELGSSGLRQYAGHVREEFLADLAGWRGARVYREMRDNDPVVGAVLFAIEMLLRGVSWRVEPASAAAADRAAADFVRQALDDLEHGFEETLSEALSFLTYGWAFFEIVYKRRQAGNSRFPDGAIGWRKFAIRAQDSLSRWRFNERGEASAMLQRPSAGGPEIVLPLVKALLFRTATHKGNPEGRSALRNAYRPWYFKRRIEEIEAIGIERDLAGLPVLRVPARVMRADASANDRATYALAKTLVRNIRRDEQEGVVLPAERDEHGQPLYDLVLLGTGGRRQFDTGGVVERYDRRIAMTVLGDIVLLGHERVGSFALADSKTGLFERALGAWLEMIAATFNRQAIPGLLRLNGLPGAARLTPGALTPPDLKALADYIQSLSRAGARLFPDAALESFLRGLAGLPERQRPTQARDLESD